MKKIFIYSLILLSFCTLLLMLPHGVKADSVFPTTDTIKASFLSALTDSVQSGIARIGYYVLVVAAWQLAFAGLLLNEVILRTIVNMKSMLDGISAINTGWQLIRNVGNMCFIFILLYVAIKTVLGLDDGNTKRIIRNVIIIGLLVNFSLFFTKVLIDTSNITALYFYNSIVTNKTTNGGASGITGFSDKFAASLGVTSIVNPNSTDFIASATGSDSYIHIFITEIGGTIFLTITALSFLYAALLLIIRFLVLVVLLLLSPLAFFLFILPQTASYAKKWWGVLAGQLIVAPLYMLMLYIVLLMSQSFSLTGAGGSTGLAGVLNLNANSTVTSVGNAGSAVSTSAFSAVFNFILIIGFLNIAAIIATMAASNTGGVVGGIVQRSRNTIIGAGKYIGRKTANVAQRTAGTVTAGSIGAVGRNTVGRYASNQLKRDGDTLKQLADNGDLRAKKRLEVLQSRASNEYDIRNLKTVSSVLGKAPNKGGYQGRFADTKAKVDAKIGRGGGYVLTTNLFSRLGQRSNISNEKWQEIYKAQNAVKEQEEVYRKAVASGIKTDIDTANTELKKRKSNIVGQQRIAVTETGKIQDEYAAKIGKKRWYNPNIQVGSSTVAFGAKAKSEASQEFLEKKRTRKPSPEEALSIKEAELRNAVTSGTVTATTVTGIDPNTIKDISGDLLSNPLVMPYLTVRQLESIRNGNKLNNIHASTIGTFLTSPPPRPAPQPTAQQIAYIASNSTAKTYWTP